MGEIRGNRRWAVGNRKTLKVAVIAGVWLSVFSLSPIAHCLSPGSAFGADRWPGVDETVVEKIAGEHGRGAREPLINTDQGDLLLFAFLSAGAVGGFAAGYCWRMLVAEKRKP